MNQENLKAKLDVLTQASGFAKTFKERAFTVAPDLKLPDLSYNADGAFIGITKVHVPAGPLPVEDNSSQEDTRSLLYDTFLVVPLLPSGAFYQERKFSGNAEPGQNEQDFIGCVVDTFAHHVVDESNGDYMLADIQGHIANVLLKPQSHPNST
ncbi:hypothetical protein D9757_007775 [Collybiopsis confluens]|uniref:Alpha-type protein kinase domain-containing protein n=1 Tax=Collybiopsis confluens TaxID=2823264 RepID=A0A8H5HQ35_9AGAR|nr:hypothetical protein D9757_009902 [Collybiopsis confluens]KAF5387417.1 hypothetical protein D9757_007775 [Collybiopsis confluens]